MKKLILSFAICFGIFVCQNGVAQSLNLQSTPITKQVVTPNEGNTTSEEVRITQTIPQISKLTQTSGGQSTTPEENIPNIVQTIYEFGQLTPTSDGQVTNPVIIPNIVQTIPVLDKLVINGSQKNNLTPPKKQ